MRYRACSDTVSGSSSTPGCRCRYAFTQRESEFSDTPCLFATQQSLATAHNPTRCRILKLIGRAILKTIRDTERMHEKDAFKLDGDLGTKVRVVRAGPARVSPRRGTSASGRELFAGPATRSPASGRGVEPAA